MDAIAKKEDNPEEALKESRAIVDQEEEKGDWYVPPTPNLLGPPITDTPRPNPTGDSKP